MFDAIRERMVELRIGNIPELSRRSGVSVTLLRRMFDELELPATLRKRDGLGRALEWAPGWDEALRAGRKPAPLIVGPTTVVVDISDLDVEARGLVLGLVDRLRKGR